MNPTITDRTSRRAAAWIWFAVLFLIIAIPLAHAAVNRWNVEMRVCDGACGTPTIVSGNGEFYVEGDLESDGNLNVAGTSALAGTITSTTGSLVQHRGAQVASATSVTLGVGNFFTVSGTTNITGVTGATAGRKVVLLFSGSLTVSDCTTCTGSVNLVMAGDFSATANDTLSLIGNGTSWIETARSAN